MLREHFVVVSAPQVYFSFTYIYKERLSNVNFTDNILTQPVTFCWEQWVTRHVPPVHSMVTALLVRLKELYGTDQWKNLG